MEERKFSYSIGNEDYIIQVKIKKIKHVYLKVSGDHQLLITASKDITLPRILQFIKSKELWIRRHPFQSEIMHKISIQDKYLILFGQKKPFTLKQGEQRNIRKTRDGFEITLVEMTQREFDQVVSGFYQYRVLTETISLRTKFDERIHPHKRPVLYVTKMKSRWGSFSAKTNRIHLNQQLVFYPIEVLEAVLAHEFAHILVRNHSMQFYKVLFSWMPDYKNRIEKMKGTNYDLEHDDLV